MRSIIYSCLLVIFIASNSVAQNIVFQEGFEGTPAVTSGGTPGWSLNTSFYNTGSNSYSAHIVNAGDSSVMITDVFSTTGNSFVMLEFSHICKIEFHDAGEIYVSNNNGMTWTKLTEVHYMGTSGFSAATGDKFTATSYLDWLPGNPSAPTNSWWKSELFDISAIAANSAQVRVMFMLRDMNNQTVYENWGWAVDDIKVTAAISELTPPTIVLQPPVLVDTVLHTGPYDIFAAITDASGVAYAALVYNVNGGTNDTIPMVNASGSTYMATIPSYTYTNTINYSVFAVDSSASANLGQSQVYSFYIKKGATSYVEIGTGTTSSSTAGPTYISSATSTYLYSNHISIFTPSELGSAGNIAAVEWYKNDAQGYTLGNATYRIYMKHTTMTSIPTATGTFTSELAGATLVYESTTQNLPTQAGWVDFIFNQSTFYYNGTGNLMILVDWYRPGSATGAVTWRYTTASGLAQTWSASVTPPNIAYSSSNRPNIRIGFVAPSYSNDAGIFEIVTPTSPTYTTASQPVSVRIKNWAVDTLTKVTVGWSVNGVVQPPFQWTGALPEHVVSLPVTIGNIALPLGQHIIKAWTTMPNDSIDQDNNNDTLEKTVLVCAGMLAGNYSVGPGGDYATLHGAIDAIVQCGLGGPVIFNLLPNAGPITGGFEITSIPGVSAINNVTFNGNGTIISQGTANFIIAFDGSSHITLNGFNIINTDPSSNIFGIMIRGGSQYLTFTNNVIDVGMSSTSSLSAGIAVSNSTTSATTTGNNGQYITISNNEIIGGYYGITLMGQASYLNCFGNVVSNNIVRDFYVYGIYLSNNDTTIITGNNISRANRLTLSTFYGIYATTSRNIKYTKNHIHSSGIGSYTSYPFYITTSFNSIGYETEIINNAIYNIPGTSTIYGMYILGTNNAINIFYNTVHLNSSSTGTQRAIFMSTAPNNYNLRNNIFSVAGPGTGTKHCIYVTNPSASFSSNNNTFYMGANFGTNYIGYWGAQQNTLANWQAITSQDANSNNTQPPFMTTENFMLANTLLSGQGVAVTGVTDDIFGTPRGNPPTIGAHEVPLIPNDAGVLNIVTPTPQTMIGEGATVPVAVTLQNFGSATVTSVDVYYTVNNGAPVMATYNGTLLPLQTTTFSMPSYIAPAGLTTLCAYTVLPGDSNTFNDTACVTYYGTPLIDAELKRIVPIAGGCGLGIDSVRVILQNIGILPVAPGFTVSYKVEGSSTVVTQTVPVSIPLSDSLKVTFNTPVDLFTNVDSVFTLVAWVTVPGDNVQYNDTAKFSIISYAIPPTPSVITPVTIGYGASALLHATSLHTVLWFDAITATTPVATGATYQTPLLYDTTTFHSAALSSAGCRSPLVPITVFVTGHPPVDAGIVTIVNPVGSALSGAPEEISVELKNFGLSNLTSVGIVWSLNSVIQDTIAWTGNLPHNGTVTVVLDTMVFISGTHCISAYTIMPNGMPDTVNSNDAAGLCFQACMTGIYTIGPPGTGTFDYHTFNTALAALNTLRPCGHVIFDVYPGTYNEQITTSHVPGVDPNTTITFRGVTGDSTSVILQFAASSSTNNWVVKLDGANYFTFKHMTIRATGASNGRVFELDNNAGNNSITNCRIETSTTSTSSSFAGIYSISNGAGSNNLTVSNCHFKGGYYGIYWYGSSGAQKKKGFYITDNIFEDFHYYGIYTYYVDSVFINGNKMTNRPGSGVLYPIYVGYTTGYGEVMKNDIATNGTGSYYGIYIAYKQAASSDPMIVANNMLKQTGNLTGTVYGMYVLGSNYVNVYYNSVRIAGGSATAGRAFFQSTGGFINILNNIFSNHNGGYAYYVNTPGAVINSDHNNYYTTGNALAYWGVAENTLVALRAVNNQDLNSLDLDPPYVSANDLHLSTTALSAKGTPVPEVTDDIDGDPRSPMPTIGADEIPLIATDAGVIAIISPGTVTNEGQLYPVVVTVANFGTAPITSLNVEYSVNGGIPVSIPYTGLIPSMGNVNITMPDMTSPAGNSVICARTVLAGDTNTFNDEFCKSFFAVPLADAMVVEIVGLENGCNIGHDTISIWVKNLGVNAINSPTPSTVTISYQVNGGLPVTEPFTPVVQPSDSVLFHFSTLADFTVAAVTDTFNVVAWIDLTGDNVKYNDTAQFAVVSFGIPDTPVIADTIYTPYATQVTLFAQSPDSVYWFASDTASVEIATGNYYTTPVLYGNTTYWVQAGSTSGPAIPGDLTTLFSGTTGQAGNMFDITAVNTLNIDSFDINCTSSGLVEVWYRPGSYVNNNTSQAGWTKLGDHNVSGAVSGTPTRMPVGGVTIPAGQTYGFYITFTTGSNMRYSSGNGSNEIYTNQDMTIEARHAGSYFSATITPRVWNGRVYYTVGGGISCASNRKPVTVVCANPVACDVGVSSIIQPNSALNLTAQEIVRVKIRNYGSSPQSNIPVSYQINNLPVVTETFTGTVSPNDSVDYIFTAQANLSVVGSIHNFKAWTGLACDNTPQNDTAWKTVINLLPSYCISSATSPANQEIVNVTLGSMNNSSPASGAMYTNHTLTVPPAILSPGVSYPLSITSGFAPGSSTQQNCWVKVWIDFNRDGVFDLVNELVYSSATTSSNTLNTTIQVPYSAVSGNTVMRVVLNQTTAEANVTPCYTYTHGETEDYMVTIAPQAACDAGVIGITHPGSMTPSGVLQPVWVKFMNFGSNPIAPNTLSVAYRLNGGTPVVATFPGGLPPGVTDSIQMPSISIPMGNNTLCAYTILACDSLQFNNEMCKPVYGEYFSPLPYYDDFETSNNWYKPASSTNWQYGTPAANIINSAYSGTKAWVTNLTGDYTNNASEHIFSPILDFSGLGVTDTVTLSFYHWLAMASGDYGQVQYSINGGAFANLGFVADPAGTNWYNTQTGGVHNFSHTNSGWMYSAYKLPPGIFNGHSNVQFRFHFFSNASVTSNGWAIDNFRVSLPVVPDDVGISAILVPFGDTASGTQVNAVVTIKNYGSNTQNMIPVELWLNNNMVTTETWTGILPSQGTVNYTFVLPFTVPVAPYHLCAKTNLQGDPFSVNDQSCRSLGVQPAFHDVGVVAIVAPQTDASGNICFHTPLAPWAYRYDMTVRIKNFGQNTQVAIPVKYSFQAGSTVYTDIWTGTLLPGDTADFLLQNEYLPPIGNHQVCIETALIGDQIPANDKVCKNHNGIACPIGVDDQDAYSLRLYQNVPNPAKGTTVIGYRVPKAGDVTFGLVSMVGQVLHSEQRQVTTGEQQIELDVSSLAAGIFYYFIEFEGQRLTRKLVVSK